MLTSPVTGPDPSVLLAGLAEDPARPPQPGDRAWAVFGAGNWPDLPSLITEAVAIPVNGTYGGSLLVKGILGSGGNAIGAVTTVSGNYTPLPSDNLILVDASGGVVTITLPDATQEGFTPGQQYTVKKTDSTGNTVTVTGTAGQLIDGVSGQNLTTSNSQTTVKFDGVVTTNWWVTAGITSLTFPVVVSASSTTLGGLLSFTQTHTPNQVAGVAFIGQAATDAGVGTLVTGDADQRFRVNFGGNLAWGPGNTVVDTTFFRSSAGFLEIQPVSGQGGLTISATNGTAALLSVVNAQSAPSLPPVMSVTAVGGDLAYGAQVGGDADPRFTVNSNGKLQWGTGSAGTDTDLYRSAVNTLTADGNLTVGGAFKANGSVFPGSAPPAVATAETFPRALIGGATGTMTTGTLYLIAIDLPNGLLVSNITFATKGTAAGTGGALTHGWYALIDLVGGTYTLRAVSADQAGSSTWLNAINTHYPLAMGTPYTTTYAGTWYLGVMVADTTMPLLATPGTAPTDNDVVGLAPILCGPSTASLGAPGTPGTTTYAAPTANAGFVMYAYTS